MGLVPSWYDYSIEVPSYFGPIAKQASSLLQVLNIMHCLLCVRSVLSSLKRCDLCALRAQLAQRRPGWAGIGRHCK